VVTVMIVNKPEMVGFWQFRIGGEWQRPSGGVSLSWQWADADSDSPFIIYNQGSNFGLSAQIAGEFLGRSYDAWINRSAFYTSKTTDLGFGFYGDKVREISIGDIFPSISKLTLDGMPARGCETEIKPTDRVALYLVGAEGRLFTDTEDEFTAGLINSKFCGFQLVVQPIKKKWELGAVYIHARNHAKSEQDIQLDIEKQNNIFSLRTDLELPAEFNLHGEWAKSDHLAKYGEEFASESLMGEGISLSLGKRIRTLALELFYLNISDEFMSEVNPFLESGRNGFGVSGKYSHLRGLWKVGGEYGRYHQGKEINSEIRANINLSLSKLPSIFVACYQQRVPYAKYDVQGVSLGSSYRIWKLDLSISGSGSIISLWADNTERLSMSMSTSMGYQITSDTGLRAEYFQFASAYKSKDISSSQRQVGIGIQHCVRKNNLLGADLKAVEFTDKENAENDYLEKVMLLKYGYSF